MHLHRQNKGLEPNKRNSRHTSKVSNANTPPNVQQTAHSATTVNQAPNMEARRSNTPDKAGDLQVQGQNTGVQGQKPSSRAFDIVNSNQDIQASPHEPGFGKPKRANTNSSLKDVAADNDFLRQQNAELSEHLANIHQTIIQQDAHSQNERIFQAESELPRLRAQVREWQEKARVAQIESDSLRDEIRRKGTEAQSTIESLMLEHNENKAENEQKIRRLLEGATRDRVDGRWNPPPDEEIRRRLLRLNTDMRDWAKMWATKNLVLDKAVSKETSTYFKDFVKFDSDNNFPVLFRKPSARMKEKVAGLLLHAALAHEVHDAFFDGKIFCLKVEEREIVEKLFQDLKKSDAKNAYIWRAGLWRLLNPPSPDDSPKVPQILETTRNNVKMYCDSISAAFRKKPANILFSVVAENSADAQNRAAKLRSILQQASAIAINLWTQHSFFTAVDLRSIQDSRMTYNNASPWLQAHSWSNVDEDSDKFNGTGILVVARPGLLAFDADDTSGVDGDRYRVLVHAIVLLDSKY